MRRTTNFASFVMSQSTLTFNFHFKIHLYIFNLLHIHTYSEIHYSFIIISYLHFIVTAQLIHIHRGLDSPHDHVSLSSDYWTWDYLFLLKKGKYLQYSSMVQCNSSAKRSNPFTPTLRMAKTSRVSHQCIEVRLFSLPNSRLGQSQHLWSPWTFGIFTSSLRDTSDGQRPQLCCHAHSNLSFINRLLEFATKEAATALTSWTSYLLQYSVSPGNLFQVIEGTKQIRLTAFSKMKRSL